MKDRLYKRLGIARGVTAVIGSGGKTTLIRKLAYELKDDGFSVIVTTSTKIFIPGYCPLVCDPTEKRDRFNRVMAEAGIVSVGRPLLSNEGTVKLACSGVSFEELASSADFVLVEADGSKHLPLKAHDIFEPVIPDCSERTVMVVGLCGVGKKVSEAAHRPEIFAKLAGISTEDVVTEESLAKVLNYENLCDVMYFAGTDKEKKSVGKKLSEMVNRPAVMEG